MALTRAVWVLEDESESVIHTKSNYVQGDGGGDGGGVDGGVLVVDEKYAMRYPRYWLACSIALSRLWSESGKSSAS